MESKEGRYRPARVRLAGSRIALLAAAGLLAGLVAAFTASGAPKAGGAHAKASACPFKGGVIRTFSTNDLSGVAGDIGPSAKRARDVWIPYLNAHGGILGCTVVADMVEEPFPDVQQCLRHYREAIASNKYDFYFGPINSACMAVVPSLTNKAHKGIIANFAADHQPFFEHFQKYNFHPGVSTFQEGRGTAVYAKKMGWKRVSTLTPNYAYGKDVVNSFTEYLKRIQPGTEVLAQQYPAFGEKNMGPFINAVVGPKPDAVVGAEFGTDVLTIWKQWTALGLKIPTIYQISLPTVESVKKASEIPPNSGGYMRGFWKFSIKTPLGKQFNALYRAKYGSTAHPVPSGWSFGYVSGVQMAKALIEQTRSLDPDAWAKLVESGGFQFVSPYQTGLTPVNPINHMADGCVGVGPLTFDKSLPVPATYNVARSVYVCLHEVLSTQEAKRLTRNPGVSAKAIALFDSLIAKKK